MELDRKRRHRPTSHVPLLIPHSGAIVDVFLFIEHIMSSSYIGKKKKKKLFFSLSFFCPVSEHNLSSGPSNNLKKKKKKGFYIFLFSSTGH